MTDATLWMPSGMDAYAKAEWVDAYPGDVHGAAAAAWEDWAAQLADPEVGTDIRSVTTGVQSVSFDGPQSARGQALARARWHRARAHVQSVAVGPEFDASSEAEYFATDGVEAGSDESIDRLWSLELP